MYDQDTESEIDQSQSQIEDEQTYCYFSEKFDKKYYENYKCVIGHGLLNNPVVDNCGHLYCKGCILTSLKNRQECPQSREALRKEDLRPVLQIKQMIDNLQITCENCETEYNIKDQQKHKQQCGYFQKYPDQKEIVMDLLQFKTNKQNLQIINENMKKAFINIWRDTIYFEYIQNYNSQKNFELQEQLYLNEYEYTPQYDEQPLQDFLKIFQKMNDILDFLEAQDNQNLNAQRQQGIKFLYENSYYILYINLYKEEIQFIWESYIKQQEKTEQTEEDDEQYSEREEQQQIKCSKFIIENKKDILVTINDNEIIFKSKQKTQKLDLKFQTSFQKESKIFAIVSRKIN